MTELTAVTGATGFIGQHVVNKLFQQGKQVRCLSSSTRLNIPHGADVVVGDIRNVDVISALVAGASSLIHLAGIAHTELTTSSEMELVRSVNVEATRKLIETARSAGVRRVLFVSSAHVYGEEGENISEDVHKHPLGFYGKSKLEAEEIALASRAVDFEVLIVRPCLVYGPNVRHNLLKMIHAIDRGRYFHLSGQNPMRSFLSTDNASRAIVHLLEHGVDGCAYNLSDRHPYALREFVNSIAKKMGRNSPHTLPYRVIKALAYCATPLTRIKPPLNRVSLRKITNSFTLNTDRLARTGFVWSGTEDAILHEMVRSYLSSHH